MRRRSYEVAYTASHRRLSVIVRASVRAQATTAPDASSPAEPTALKSHLVKWGRALAAANRADALGRYFASEPAPRVEPPAGAATFEVATAGISAAHGQLAAITRDWNANAQVHLCGSSVTQAHVTATSDLDFVCLPNGRETSGVAPDRHKQLAAVEGLHRHVQRYLPTYMRRGFIAMKTARTPVAKFGFTHEPPVKVRITQQLDAGAADLKPAALVNTAAGSSSSAIMHEVPDAVRRSKFVKFEEKDEEAARTVLLHFRGMPDVDAKSVETVLSTGGPNGKPINATVLAVQNKVSDAFQHPLGYDAPTNVAEDHSLTLQAEAAAASKRLESTMVTVRAGTAVDALRVIAAFPDGKLVPKTKRDVVTADFADRRVVPELLRFQWDVSFAGFSVANSYLLRHYLLGASSPRWTHHGSLALKRWARRSHVANAHLGYLTPYGSPSCGCTTCWSRGRLHGSTLGQYRYRRSCH
jgi:hypothetical protein